MAKFKKKSDTETTVTVEAFQYKEGGEKVKGVCDCTEGNPGSHIHTGGTQQIVNLEDNDWVFADLDGNHFVRVKDEEFKKLYQTAGKDEEVQPEIPLNPVANQPVTQEVAQAAAGTDELPNPMGGPLTKENVDTEMLKEKTRQSDAVDREVKKIDAQKKQKETEVEAKKVSAEAERQAKKNDSKTKKDDMPNKTSSKTSSKSLATKTVAKTKPPTAAKTSAKTGAKPGSKSSVARK